jgi:nicotinamidase-related amidase
MADLKLDRTRTLLLMADFSAGNMAQNPIVKERHTFERAGEVLAAARSAGVPVAYCISHFRPGYPEIPEHDNPRSAMRASGEVLPADPAMLIHASVKPKEGEPVIAKHRTSAFSGSAFETILRAQGIDTIILMGHATSGVILSTVRLAADLDYHLMVVEDGCADRDPEVHKVLMEKVFPRQATVVSSKEMAAALAALGKPGTPPRRN